MLDLLVVAAALALGLERVDHGPGVAAENGRLNLVLGDVDGLLAGLVGDGGQVRACHDASVHGLVRDAEHLGGEVHLTARLPQGVFDLLD